MKTIVSISLLCLAVPGPRGGLGLVQASSPDPFLALDRLDREAVIRAVLARNPTIEALHHAWDAAREREAQSSSLDDPRAHYGLAPLGILGDVRFGQSVGLTQRLPYPGKLRIQGEIARHEARAARYDYEAMRAELATTASLLFDDYYFAARATEINEEHIQLLEELQRIATVRYASGLATQQDPLQAEVELSRLLHRRVTLRTSQITVTARLNALLHRPPAASLPPPPSELPAPDGASGAEASVDDALAERPELEASLAEVEAKRAAVRLRAKDVYPDFEATTSFNSMWSESKYRWTVGIGVDLPLHRDRLRAASAEAVAALERVESERAAVEDAVRMEVYVARERLREAQHVLELYRSRLLPASSDQIRAARIGFETGRNSFLELIEAERNQRSLQLGYEQALTDLYRRRAELDRALGRVPDPPEMDTEGDVR